VKPTGAAGVLQVQSGHQLQADMVDKWQKFDQKIIDWAINQWRPSLTVMQLRSRRTFCTSAVSKLTVTDHISK